MEGQVDWRAHADFMNGLAAEGFVLLGGPFRGTRDVLLIVRAENRQEVEARLVAGLLGRQGPPAQSLDRTVGIAAGLPRPLTLRGRTTTFSLPFEPKGQEAPIMQSQERELISGLFGRLQPFETQPRDSEAEALIKDTIARQPAAPYLLVQTVLVQEQALKAAQERIAELEAGAGAAAPAASGFLGSAPKIGPWGASPPHPPRRLLPCHRHARRCRPRVAPQQGGGGGFLRTAMATAAGVAGGALLFEGIRNLMGSNPGPFGQTAAARPRPCCRRTTSRPWPTATRCPMTCATKTTIRAAYDDSGGDMGGSDDEWA